MPEIQFTRQEAGKFILLKQGLPGERRFTGKDGIQVHDQITAAVTANGPLCFSDLHLPQKVDWYWKKSRLSRAALEQMYFYGELSIHHKHGNIK